MDKTAVIPFIYQYCDRWCERCAFTDRCDVALEEKRLTNGQKDLSSAAYLVHVVNDFQNIMDLIIQNTPQMSLEDADEKQSAQTVPSKLINSEEKAKIEAQIEQLTHFIRVYSAQVKHWIQVNDALLTRDKAQNLALADALSVIEWYSFSMTSKVHRVTSLFFDPLSIPTDPIQNDRNGTAKLALVFVEKSLGAWESVRTIFPEMTDGLIDIFLTLTHIKRDVQMLFPDAHKFKRPGFDDLESEEIEIKNNSL
ncbi:MAG: hypothetical protein HC817_03285 [Saprospiraceae bacterium]|nr:hypothetical protein [Saprospiraceae bacterium]